MRAISLWQPWASLCIWREKEYETRHWIIPAGVYALHAAKKFTPVIREFCACDQYATHVIACHGGLSALKFGAVLGIIQIHTAIETNESLRLKLSPKELAFGNYTDGRYASKITVLRQYKEPFPANGHQGIWKFEPEDKSLLETTHDDLAWRR